MNQKQIDFLSSKIVSISTQIEKLLEDKKELNNGYNRQIKDYKKRVKTYCLAISTDNIDYLGEVMGEFEVAEIGKIGNEKET
jgi:hypothetical protein